MAFIVMEILSGDEFLVEKGWVWPDKQNQMHRGNKVVVFGYQTPQSGMPNYEYAKQKLAALLDGKKVELYYPQFIKKYGYEALVCSVYLNGIDIANYFPEFKRQFRGFIPDEMEPL